MSDTSTIPAISGSTIVGVPIDKAFRVFTGSFNTWWPREFHIGQAEMAEAILEPRYRTPRPSAGSLQPLPRRAFGSSRSSTGSDAVARNVGYYPLTRPSICGCREDR